MQQAARVAKSGCWRLGVCCLVLAAALQRRMAASVAEAGEPRWASLLVGVGSVIWRGKHHIICRTVFLWAWLLFGAGSGIWRARRRTVVCSSGLDGCCSMWSVERGGLLKGLCPFLDASFTEEGGMTRREIRWHGITGEIR